jgi:hypothetical protein
MHERGGIDSRFWGYNWDDSTDRSPTVLGCAKKVLKSEFRNTDSDQLLCIAHFQVQQYKTHNYYTDNNAQSLSELSSPTNSGVYNPEVEDDVVSLNSPTSPAGSDSFQHHLMAANIAATPKTEAITHPAYISAAKPKRLANHPIFLLQKKVSILDESYHNNEDRSEMDYGSKCSPNISTKVKTDSVKSSSAEENLMPSANVDNCGTIKFMMREKNMNINMNMNVNCLFEQEMFEHPVLVHRKQRAWTSWLQRVLVCGFLKE